MTSEITNTTKIEYYEYQQRALLPLAAKIRLSQKRIQDLDAYYTKGVQDTLDKLVTIIRTLGPEQVLKILSENKVFQEVDSESE